MNSNNSLIKVRKNSGELVDFDVEKLKIALARSGADEAHIEEVIVEVEKTFEAFSFVFGFC